MCRYSCIFSELILREISNGLSFCVLERENRKAPNQHRLFVPCPKKRSTPALLLSLSTLSTSTPKPRAEGSSPSAPAKKERQASACLSFFVATGVKPRHAERVGHRRRSAACGGYSEAGMAQRSAIGKAALPPQTEPGTARGLAKQVQVRPSISAMLWRTSPPFPCFIALFLTQLHPPPTAATPSSTQNAPGFALFGGGPGAVGCFCPLLACKIWGLVFVTWLVAPPLFWGLQKAGRDAPGLGKIALLFAQIQGIASQHFCGFICISLLDYLEG